MTLLLFCHCAIWALLVLSRSMEVTSCSGSGPICGSFSFIIGISLSPALLISILLSLQSILFTTTQTTILEKNLDHVFFKCKIFFLKHLPSLLSAHRINFKLLCCCLRPSTNGPYPSFQSYLFLISRILSSNHSRLPTDPQICSTLIIVPIRNALLSLLCQYLAHLLPPI